MMIIVVLLSFMIWKSLDSYLGWPTLANPPNKAILIWAVVNEPSRKLRDPGSIYLWLKPREASARVALFGYAPSLSDPRVYKLPYSRKTHKDVVKSLELIQNFKSVEVEFGGRKSNYGYLFGEGGTNAPGSTEFYELPPPKLPPKS